MDENSNPRLEPPAWCKAASATERFVIRALRVICGVTIVGFAIWLFSIAIETLGKPFASLSPLGLLGGIVAGLGGLGLLVVAFGVAFGEKGDSRIEIAWRRRQAETVQSRRKLLGYDK